MSESAALAKAKLRAGSSSSLARKLGLSRQAVQDWQRVPHTRVLEVERITGVPRTQLRPDLYPRSRRRSS